MAQLFNFLKALRGGDFEPQRSKPTYEGYTAIAQRYVKAAGRSIAQYTSSQREHFDQRLDNCEENTGYPGEPTQVGLRFSGFLLFFVLLAPGRFHSSATSHAIGQNHCRNRHNWAGGWSIGTRQ